MKINHLTMWLKNNKSKALYINVDNYDNSKKMYISLYQWEKYDDDDDDKSIYERYTINQWKEFIKDCQEALKFAEEQERKLK